MRVEGAAACEQERVHPVRPVGSVGVAHPALEFERPLDQCEGFAAAAASLTERESD